MKITGELTEEIAGECVNMADNEPDCERIWISFVNQLIAKPHLLGKEKPARRKKDKPAHLGKNAVNDGDVGEGAFAATTDGQDAHSEADSEAGGDSKAED